MRRQSFLFVCAVLVVSYAASGHAQAPAATAGAAAKASPELVSALSKDLGSTPEQAAGAAGALFGIAKTRLNPDQFSKVAAAVPGMDSLLKAAPSGTGAFSSITDSAVGLAGAANAFTKLGLKPDMVAKAVPVLTSFVTKSGGADVGNLLAGALK